VGEHGSAYARFRRAIDRGNTTAALSAAAELETVGLTEALELTLLLREDQRRFDRACVRWTARYVSDYGTPLEEAQAVLALLSAVRTERGAAACGRSPSSSIGAALSARPSF
jgi:hypothetical protein